MRKQNKLFEQKYVEFETTIAQSAQSTVTFDKSIEQMQEALTKSTGIYMQINKQAKQEDVKLISGMHDININIIDID